MPECPGLYDLAAMRDGPMARLRVPGGRLTARAAIGLAAAARACGSGAIDLTNRANLQLRGLDTGRIGALHAELDRLGLAPRTRRADRARNILASPLDADGALPRLVHRIDAAIARAADAGRLEGLPVKACCVIDGGTGDVIGLGHDVGLIREAGDIWRLSLAGEPSDRGIASAGAPGLVTQLFEAMARARRRIGAMERAARGEALLRTGLFALAEPPLPHWPEPADDLGEGAGHLALRAPLDGLGADGLAALGTWAEQGDGLVRLAPHRRIVLAGLRADASATLLAEADKRGFAAGAHPLRIVACAGAKGCPRTARDTRGDAASLAAAITKTVGETVGETRTPHRPATIHLSGCRRGCARPGPADWLLRAEGDAYALFADAAADTDARALETVSPAALPARLAARLGAIREAA